jgi:hypothetical protein
VPAESKEEPVEAPVPAAARRCLRFGLHALRPRTFGIDGDCGGQREACGELVALLLGGTHRAIALGRAARRQLETAVDGAAPRTELDAKCERALFRKRVVAESRSDQRAKRRLVGTRLRRRAGPRVFEDDLGALRGVCRRTRGRSGQEDPDEAHGCAEAYLVATGPATKGPSLNRS